MSNKHHTQFDSTPFTVDWDVCKDLVMDDYNMKDELWKAMTRQTMEYIKEHLTREIPDNIKQEYDFFKALEGKYVRAKYDTVYFIKKVSLSNHKTPRVVVRITRDALRHGQGKNSWEAEARWKANIQECYEEWYSYNSQEDPKLSIIQNNKLKAEELYEQRQTIKRETADLVRRAYREYFDAIEELLPLCKISRYQPITIYKARNQAYEVQGNVLVELIWLSDGYKVVTHSPNGFDETD